MAEHTVTYYADPHEPAVFEWSPDGIFWEPTAAYNVRPVEGCDTHLIREATVDVESGWVRYRYLLGNPARFDSQSNHIALPEPAWIGLVSGLLMVFLMFRGKRRVAR